MSLLLGQESEVIVVESGSAGQGGAGVVEVVIPLEIFWCIHPSSAEQGRGLQQPGSNQRPLGCQPQMPQGWGDTLRDKTKCDTVGKGGLCQTGVSPLPPSAEAATVDPM